MFRKLSRKLDSSIKGKYYDMDLSSLGEEDFKRLTSSLYRDIAFRGLGGILLLVVCLIILVNVSW